MQERNLSFVAIHELEPPGLPAAQPGRTSLRTAKVFQHGRLHSLDAVLNALVSQ